MLFREHGEMEMVVLQRGNERNHLIAAAAGTGLGLEDVGIYTTVCSYYGIGMLHDMKYASYMSCWFPSAAAMLMYNV